MGNQRENNDELLFGLLSEKLYSHYCGSEEEHLSKEEEQAVINMMNSLQVEEKDDFDPTSSYKKFCDKYLTNGEAAVKENRINNIEELLVEMEKDIDNMKEPEKPLTIISDILAMVGRLGRMRVVRRVALAVLIITVMFCGMNIGTYATAKMGFVEFLSKNDNGWSFMVTGEDDSVDMDEIEKNVYKSWEEVKKLEGMNDILIPKWIPDVSVLEEILIIQGPDKKSFIGKYFIDNEEQFQIVVQKYTEEIGWQFFVREAKDKYAEAIIGERNVLWYEEEEKTVCFFVEDKCSYYVCGDISIEEIEKIIKNIK